MTDLDDLIAYTERQFTGHPEKDRFIEAILARLVSLRDAGKELPEPVAYYWWPEGMREDKANGFTPMIYKPDYDALRAHAVADRANLSIVHGALKASMEAHKKAESRVRALEAEAAAMGGSTNWNGGRDD